MYLGLGSVGVVTFVMRELRRACRRDNARGLDFMLASESSVGCCCLSAGLTSCDAGLGGVMGVISDNARHNSVSDRHMLSALRRS